jgi:hypothetical protein
MLNPPRQSMVDESVSKMKNENKNGEEQKSKATVFDLMKKKIEVKEKSRHE